MYQIFYSNDGYYSQGIVYDPRAADYAILDGKLTQKLNTAGTLSFTLPPGRSDPLSYRGVMLKDRGETLFSGRITKTETDFEGFTTVTCEGLLGELNGFIVRPYDFSGTDAQAADSAVRYLALLLTKANADSEGGWTFGTCSDAIKKLGYSGRSSTLYPTLLDEIQQKLIQKEGGYLRASTTLDDGRILRVLDYVTPEDYGVLSDQPIELGRNLTDKDVTIDRSDWINSLVPLGKTGTDGQRLTVQNAVVDGKTYGKDYVQIQAENGYCIAATQIWEDVTDPTNLYNKAVAYLESASQASVSISVSAADLSLAGYDVSPIRLGDRVSVVKGLHGFDVTMLCTGRTYDLLDPAKDTVKLTSTMSASTITEFMAAAGR